MNSVMAFQGPCGNFLSASRKRSCSSADQTPTARLEELEDRGDADVETVSGSLSAVAGAGSNEGDCMWSEAIGAMRGWIKGVGSRAQVRKWRARGAPERARGPFWSARAQNDTKREPISWMCEASWPTKHNWNEKMRCAGIQKRRHELTTMRQKLWNAERTQQEGEPKIMEPHVGSAHFKNAVECREVRRVHLPNSDMRKSGIYGTVRHLAFVWWTLVKRSIFGLLYGSVTVVSSGNPFRAD